MNMKPLNLKPTMEITLYMRVVEDGDNKGKTIYQWRGNDGWNYSPVIESHEDADQWPKNHGLRRHGVTCGEDA